MTAPATGTTATNGPATSDVSWHQERPTVSLELLDALGIGPSAGVIDVGGGSSRLVDELVARGFTDLTVLDVSPAALDIARRRLDHPDRVTWLQQTSSSGPRRAVGTCGTTAPSSTSSPIPPTAPPTSAVSPKRSRRPVRSSSARSPTTAPTTAPASLSAATTRSNSATPSSPPSPAPGSTPPATKSTPHRREPHSPSPGSLGQRPDQVHGKRVGGLAP